ncbi:related to postreplication repair protein uvsH/nuvA [Ustilago trichophora]|uniref:Related to postreplication repair protein uvsH/nuvA n=1 Tax=Ustilago trichophora TaxID=86804 RepID=A0A5C3E736_9BASI|nr:related to postreplication repair protein uvsH/nuvA [Ustilago trichophora]
MISAGFEPATSSPPPAPPPRTGKDYAGLSGQPHARCHRPSDWNNDFSILRNLDASLRCDLCFDIYTSPVSIKSCHHTFCSTCIRTHINQSGNTGSFCPKCRQTKAYDSELIPQPVLEALSISPAVESKNVAGPSSVKRPPPSQQNGITVLQHPLAVQVPAGQSASKRSTPLCLRPTTGSRSSPLTIDDDEEDLIDALMTIMTLFQVQSAPVVDERRNQTDQDASAKASERELKADDLVECPICSHKFTVTALNRHLDRRTLLCWLPRAICRRARPRFQACQVHLVLVHKRSFLFFDNNDHDGAANTSNEKRLVRPQYNLKSERDLRKLLDDAGLSTSGDREKMKDLAAWERTKASAKDHSAHVDRQKTTWIKANKSQFDDLIQKAKMGAIKDKKLREAPLSSSDDATETASAPSVNVTHGHSEVDPHVITSSPVVHDTGSDSSSAIGAVGADSS